jgi:hypothetical protein
MGFEIKNICTVVPNPHHPGYGDRNNKYFYFSVFITPRLQFDGELREFYEMLHWPSYTGIFSPGANAGRLDFIYGIVNDHDSRIPLETDATFINIPGENNKPIDITENRVKIWEKLFRPDTPVTAWPIYLKPQKEEIVVTREEAMRKIVTTPSLLEKYVETFPKEDQRNVRTQTALINAAIQQSGPDQAAAPKIVQNSPNAGDRFIQNVQASIKSEKLKDRYENSKLNQEFHKKISALARYPHLLRILGLIQDFRVLQTDLPYNPVTKDTIPDNNLVRLQFDMLGIKNLGNADIDFKEFAHSVEFICPFTRFTIMENGHKMEAYSHVFDVTDVKRKQFDYANFVQDGFINVQKFVVNQEYLENATQDITDQAQSQDSNVRFNGKTFKPEELDVIRCKTQNMISKGLSIKIKSQPDDLLTNMDSALDLLTDDNILSGKFAFEAHHLDCGYRIDVGEEKGYNWKSLCRRRAAYNIDTSDNKCEKSYSRIIAPFDDEPWLEEVRQVDNEGNPRRFEEVARWNNWSLTCPPLHAENKAGCDTDNNEYNDLALTDIRPLGLPRLRFDGKYSFRIRVVDICGNSVPFQTQETPDACILKLGEDGQKITYNRLEPIQTPVLFPPDKIVLEDKDGKISINPNYPGEGPETLVIRTQIDGAGIHIPLNEKCVRYVMPAHVAPHLAETSGVFDKKWFPGSPGTQDNLYDFLKQTPADHYPKDMGGSPVPFVFDPRVQCFVLFDEATGKNIDAHRVTDPVAFRPVTATPEDILPSTKVVALSLQSGKYGFSGNSFFLPGGSYRSVWIASGDDSSKLSEPKRLTLVHAVQRPVYANGKAVDNNIVPLRAVFAAQKRLLSANSKDDEKYHVVLNPFVDLLKQKIGEKMPATTVGEFIVTAEYADYILDPSADAGWRYLGNPTVIRKSFNNYDASTEDDILDTLVRDEHTFDRFLEETGNYVQGFRHSYPDTQTRQVYYRLEAISKFLHYFNDKDLSDKENAFRVVGDMGQQIIENSAKPSKPTLTSIVPLFTTSDDGDQDGRKGERFYTFNHDAFRVYLGGTWYETGLGEEIAVIFEKNNPTDLDDSAPQLNKVDIIAHDPTVDSAVQVVPIHSDQPFIKNVVSHPVKGKSLTARDTLDIGLFPLKPGNKIVDVSGPEAAALHTNPYDFSVFPVQWDKKRQQFYADISLAQIDQVSYSAFIKLAVCRYQKDSLFRAGEYDYRFSDVVMTDMVTLLPMRTVKTVNEQVQIDLHGKPGSRYNGEKNMPNQFYLVCEHKTVAPDITLTKIGGQDTDVIKLNALQWNIAGFSRKYERVTLEEYEDIQLDDQPADHLYVRPVNPRNDPGKRLVFFCPVL